MNSEFLNAKIVQTAAPDKGRVCPESSIKLCWKFWIQNATHYKVYGFTPHSITQKHLKVRTYADKLLFIHTHLLGYSYTLEHWII